MYVCTYHTYYICNYVFVRGSAFIKLVDDARLIARFGRRKTPGGGGVGSKKSSSSP